MKLCLGTVQLGLSYGIAGNRKPDFKEGLDILNRAAELGIDTFDTAAVYGNAEEILGAFNKNVFNADKIKIISKPTPNMDILQSVQTSLERVGQEQLDGYILHDAKALYSTGLKKDIMAIKNCGYVKNVGVSIYEPQDALFAANEGWIDYIQIPYNVFDQRLDQVGFFEVAKKTNKTIFARSALLQGLLAMSGDDACKRLMFAQKYILDYNRLTQKYGYSNSGAAIQYVKENKCIDYLVFGVDNINQLEEFIKLYENGVSNEKMIEEMRITFDSVEKRVLMPNLW